MNNELIIKKCKSCGATVKVINDCNCNGCGIVCCGEPMEKLVPNSVDAAVEKHVPTYEKVGDEIIVTVNHVMEEEHFIEWVCMVEENKEMTFDSVNACARYFKVSDSAIFNRLKGRVRNPSSSPKSPINGIYFEEITSSNDYPNDDK